MSAMLDELRQAIDEAFAGRERVTMREVYSQASRHVNLSADLLTHLNELPEGAYDKRELTEAVNEVITRRGEQDTLGLLEVPRQVPHEPPGPPRSQPIRPDDDEGPDLMR
ncbi:hypothetical protein [Nonomuraea candida]|uniref:hypothetical protein n=1 Tax=Nonomuraea candida TaxID=359159 RepID=UPI000AB600E1|nr:hypothetical protein [Nonomuraea candida]